MPQRSLRLLRLALLYSLGVSSTVCVFGSFLMQLYGPPPQASRRGAAAELDGRSGQAGQVVQTQSYDRDWTQAWCAATLRGLQVELEEQFAQSAAHVEQPRAWRHFSRWQVSYRARLQSATATCDAPADHALHHATVALARIDAAYAAASASITAESEAPRQQLRALWNVFKR
jgi:hypothetical protein